MGGTQRNGRRSHVGNGSDGIESLETRRLFAVVTSAVPDLSGMSQGIIYTFDAPVDNDAVKNSLTIWNTNSSIAVTHSQLAVATVGTNQVRVTWPGLVGRAAGELGDGNFESILEDGVGSPVTTRSVTPFFFLLADANRDRKTGFEDLVALSQNYNGTGKTYAQGDFDYDHKVNFTDLVYLAATYTRALLPPTTGSTLTVTSTTSNSATLNFTAPIDSGTSLPSTQFERFVVYRSVDGVTYTQVSTQNDPALQNSGAASYSWTSTGLSPGTTYSYLVGLTPMGDTYPVTKGGWNESNEVSATTAASAVITAPASGTSKAGVRDVASSRVALDLLDGSAGTFASTRRIGRESVIV